MQEFNVDSVGLTKGEFIEAIHRFSLRFFGLILALGAGMMLIIIGLIGWEPYYLIFPGSIIAAIVLFFEMKAQGNYARFDYMDTVLHFRFGPDGWAIIRNNEISEKAEYTWKETERLWQTKHTLLLCPSKNGIVSYTLPKRSLTPEQLEAVLTWQKAGK